MCTLLAILSSLIRVYTICHFQHSDQGLQYLPFSVWSGSTLFAILSSLIRVYSTCQSQQSDQGQSLHCHFQEQSDQDLHYKLILSSLIRVYTFCHSQQSNQGIHYLPFSAVWSESTLFANLSYQGLHYLPRLPITRKQIRYLNRI